MANVMIRNAIAIQVTALIISPLYSRFTQNWNSPWSHETGYDGGLCQDEIDECLAIDCGNGECVDLIADFRCDCDLGYEGRYCQDQM